MVVVPYCVTCILHTHMRGKSVNFWSIPLCIEDLFHACGYNISSAAGVALTVPPKPTV